MKYTILTIIFLAAALNGMAQSGSPDIVKKEWGSFTGIPAGINPAEFNNWKSQSMEGGAFWGSYNGIKGNVFYNEGWNEGYVLLQDKRIEKNVPINFNVYTNEIYMLLDSAVLVVDPTLRVSEFGINDKKNDPGKTSVFKCGYPAIDNNTIKSFYNVIVNNKIALLLHYNKRIMEAKDPTGVPEKKFINSESWYVYNAPEKKMIPVKKNKKSLLEALPQYAINIESIIQEKKLKLKAEDEWVILFNELNKLP